MARARNIKPGFYANEDLAECSIWARFIFPGLWMLADREGRLEYRPKKIKGELLRFDSVDAEPLLLELQALGFILIYDALGKKYIQIIKFRDHQNPHYKEAPSTIPAPDGWVNSLGLDAQSSDDDTETDISMIDGETSGSDSDDKPMIGGQTGLIPDSGFLIPDSGSQREEAPAKPSPADRGTRLPKDWTPDDEQIAFCRQERPDLDPHGVASRFRDHWIAQPGVKGRKSDWPATWRNWVRNERAAPRANGEKFDPVTYVNRNRVDRFAGAK